MVKTKVYTIGSFFALLMPEEFESKSWLWSLKYFSTSRQRNLLDEKAVSMPGYLSVLLNVLGQGLNHILATLILLRAFQSDDGTCEILLEKKGCLASLALDLHNDLCVWHEIGEYCSFNLPSFSWLDLIR